MTEEKPKIRLKNFVETYRAIRKLGFKEVWSRWKLAYMMTPQDEILKGQLRFFAIIIAGLWITSFYLVYLEKWVFLPACLGTIGLLYYQAKPVLIQLMQYKKMEEDMEKVVEKENNEEDKKKELMEHTAITNIKSSYELEKSLKEIRELEDNRFVGVNQSE